MQAETDKEKDVLILMWSETQMLSADLINGAAAAAAYTGLPQRTIYHLVETGQLPAIRKGRRLYFRKTELEQSFSSAA